MRYRVRHTTEYRYSEHVAFCHNEACLLLRDAPMQRVGSSALRIEPAPAVLAERLDFFGNRLSYFAIETGHEKLKVTCDSEVETHALDPLPLSEPWETVCSTLGKAGGDAGIEARSFTLDSPFVETGPAFVEFAAASFAPGRALLDAVQDLTSRIFEEFRYDPSFTTVVTPLSEVLAHRRGVCQDFAHLMLACLRSHGLAARYVSGYLETQPPPGKPKLAGADASHAWIAVFLPPLGWFDFDPTNGQRAGERYVTTAWGRDYGDVAPLRGVIFGGGEHKLDVAVDVLPSP